MDFLSLLVGIWFILLVALVVAKAAKRAGLRDLDEEEQETGDGYAPPQAWSELDTFAMRFRSGHPLQ